MQSRMYRGVCGAVLLIVATAGIAAPPRLLATSADDLCVPTDDPCVVDEQYDVTSGSQIDVGTRELLVTSQGSLRVGTGVMTVRAGTLTVEVGGLIEARGTSSTGGGSLTAEIAGTIWIAGEIDARGAPGGAISLSAGGAITLTEDGRIVVRSTAGDDSGGNVTVRGEDIDLAGGVIGVGGPEGNGGQIDIAASGDLTVSGEINASGGEGGGIDLDAGMSGGAGNLTVAETAEAKADATVAGGDGGLIDLTARGDGSATGNVVVEGTVSVAGAGGGEDSGGGFGGDITVFAAGSIRGRNETARISVAGGGPDGFGGDLDLDTDHGVLDTWAELDVSSQGSESSGGALTADIAGDVMLRGRVVGTAGDDDGGEVTIESAGGNVLIAETASVDVSARAGGTGGTINLVCGESGAGPVTAVTVAGSIRAEGGSGGGSGGSIDIEGLASVRITAPLSMRGGSGGGSGGAVSIEVDPGAAYIESAITASGNGSGGTGGEVSIDAEESVSIGETIDVGGMNAGAGSIAISSSGPVDVLADLLASNSGNGAGGQIDVTSAGDVTIAGTLASDAGGAAGGTVDIEGCTVTVCGFNAPECPAGETGVLSSLGPSGKNRVIGRDIAAVLGTMQADEQTGRNELVYDGSPAREPVVLGDVVPTAVLVVNTNLLPCPACGNGIAEPPETCDDGNRLDGDGCSADCQMADPLVGDVNRDLSVEPDDVGFLIIEIFDGDGDDVGMVGAGAFFGGPGADANDDGRITGADIAAIVILLGGQ